STRWWRSDSRCTPASKLKRRKCSIHTWPLPPCTESGDGSRQLVCAGPNAPALLTIWNLDLLLRLWIEARARLPLLLHQLAKTGQDKFAVPFNLFVGERAERIEKYSI